MELLKSSWSWFSEFSNQSSIHGVKYIGKRNRSVFEKIFWVIFLILSISGCSFMVLEMYDKWKNGGNVIVPSENLKHLLHINFPAVTICAKSKYKRNDEELMEFRNRYSDFLKEEEDKKKKNDYEYYYYDGYYNYSYEYDGNSEYDHFQFESREFSYYGENSYGSDEIHEKSTEKTQNYNQGHTEETTEESDYGNNQTYSDSSETSSRFILSDENFLPEISPPPALPREYLHKNDMIFLTCRNQTKINKTSSIFKIDEINEVLRNVSCTLGSSSKSEYKVFMKFFDKKKNFERMFRPILTSEGMCYTFNMYNNSDLFKEPNHG
jgi:hypothetical protein